MTLLTPLLALAFLAGDEPTPALVPPRKPGEVWHMTLPEAIRIGLDNSEVIRVISLGTKGLPVGGFEPEPSVPAGLANGPAGNTPLPTVGPNRVGVTIARLNADTSIWNFKAAVMAHVRSIEQQYWALSFQSVNLWSRETAVRLAEEILKREQAKPQEGRNQVDIDEAQQQLDNFKLNLITATSDLMTTERQLRNILGLPSNDTRRIAPDTAPTEVKAEPNWKVIRNQMLAMQPDIAQQRELLALADLQAASKTDNLDLSDEKQTQEQYQRDRQFAFLRQIIRQAEHSLARFFLEVDANYKQFRAAQSIREAGVKRLEAQRAFHEEGRITIDRLLDAVSQYANAVSQEAQYKASYNTSLVALEEAKGTLLAYEGVTLTLEPSPRKADIAANPPTAAPTNNNPSAATTYKVRAWVAGLKLIDVEVEVNNPSPTAPK